MKRLDALSASERRLAMERAARAAILREFTAMITHEINQPLASVAASGEAALRWLDRSTPEVEEAIRSLERVIEHKDRAADVVAMIRRRVNEDVAVLEAVGLEGVLRQAIGDLAADLEAFGVEVVLDPPPDLPPVMINAAEAELVFLHLLRNAIEAMSDRDTRVIEIECRHMDASLVVTVRDTGVGVEPGDWSRLFEPFFTTKPGAEGIGLAIGRSIISRSGGRLGLQSSDAGGSTFALEIPFAPRVPR